MVLVLHVPEPAFCLWKQFSQRINLTREVRKYRNKGKVKGDQIVIMYSLSKVKDL